MKGKLTADEFQRRVKAKFDKLNVKPAPAKPAPKPGKEEDGITIKSSTPGSDKRFRITVDDSGVISAAEIK